jgi:hypothetical protein
MIFQGQPFKAEIAQDAGKGKRPIKKYQRTHSIDINGINGGGVVKQLSKT